MALYVLMQKERGVLFQLDNLSPNVDLDIGHHGSPNYPDRCEPSVDIFWCPANSVRVTFYLYV